MGDIIFTCLVSIICLALILISYRFSKGFFYKNTVVYFLYNSVLYYKLFFDSKWGTSLLWLFYLLVFSVVHIIDIGFLFNKKKKRIKTGDNIRNISENYKKYKLEKIGVRM